MHNLNGWMAAGWVIMALIWIGIAILAILAFKWFLRHNEATTKQNPGNGMLRVKLRKNSSSKLRKI
jgi:hypothetical protein